MTDTRGQDDRATCFAFRSAAGADLMTVARLRWSLEGAAPVATQPDFENQFIAWAYAHADSHSCTVAVREGSIIWVARLALIQRVPSARALHRASGDVQCVYVVPELRNSGLGGRLLATVLDRADELGLERVTVHSSEGAVTAYERAGFASSPWLLQRYARSK